MLRQIMAIASKDVRVILRDTGALVTLFIMPIVFIFIMTSIGAGAGPQGSSDLRLLALSEDAGPLGTQALGLLGEVAGFTVVTELDGTQLTRQRIDQLVRADAYPAAIIVPADFSAQATRGDGAGPTVTLVADPAGGARVIQPIEGVVAGVFGRVVAAARGLPATPQLRVEHSAPAGLTSLRAPSAAEHNVPAYTIFGIFWIVQALGLSMLREHADGTLRRIQAAPVSRGALLAGKLLPPYLVSLLQVGLMFSVGVVVFNMGLGRDPLALLLVTLATAMAAASLGLLIAAVSATAEQVGGISNILLITMAALGGMFIPAAIMPEFMQRLARLTPHYWALKGYQDIIVRGEGLGAAAGEIGVLLGFATALFGLALWREQRTRPA